MITMSNNDLDAQIREKALKILDLTSGNICPRCRWVGISPVIWKHPIIWYGESTS